MNIVYRIALLVIMTAVMPLSTMHLWAQSDNIRLDSLRNALDGADTPLQKISVLRELSDLYWQEPEEVVCIKEIIDLSMQIDSIDYVYDGLAQLCRHYYNQEKEDSLVYWKNQMDLLCRKRGETPALYYRAGNLLCRYYRGTFNYELAISEAFTLINEARRARNDYGLMIANQSLGFVYQGIGRDSDAVVAYRDGLAYMKKLSVEPGYEIEYMSEMILSCLHENLLDEAEPLLNQYHALFVNLCKDFENRRLSYPGVWHRWLIDAYFAELYMKKGQFAKAKGYMKKADEYAETSTDEVMKYQYYRVKALYCFMNKDYKMALQVIDKALRIEANPDFLKLKIDILRSDGQKAVAMKVYDDLFALNARINDDAFNQQISQLRTLNNLSEQEYQTYELKQQNEQLALKQQLLIMVIAVASILLVLLSILFRYYLRTTKLKNALQMEKDSLVDSERLLRIAKEEAEEANRLKTAFISNISHEVRTPLNAIVGFSRLLGSDVDNYSDEEKKEFTSIISKNSNTLLHLVNDVLDFSRLDSGKINLAVKPCDVIVCCHEAIEEIRPLVVSEVKLIFEPFVSQYLLDTDILRFKQVLVNLLRNAAKFTQEGEITLSFEIDEANRQVRFEVTDTGCGIPFELQLRIFDCFEKLDEFVQGTGLGLPICRKIVNLLKGRLYVDTDYTAGARFVFIHPVGLLK